MVVGFVLLAVAFVTSRKLTAVPDAKHLEDQTLAATEKNGKELWRVDFPLGFWKEYYSGDRLRSLVWTGDIDGDAKSEVLFVYYQPDPIGTGTQLYCFSQDGTVKWQYKAGRPVQNDRGERFAGNYYSLITADTAHRQVIVRSNNSVGHPHQLSLLDSSGKLFGEHWHPGHINYTAIADLDSDGRDDLLFAGVNNDAAQATIIVLDPEELSRAGPVPEGTLDQMCRFSRRLQKRIVFFPHSCITTKFNPYNRAFKLFVGENSITVYVSATYGKA